MPNRVANIQLLDEVNVVVGGIDETLITFLYNKFGINAPGYFFNPRYKLGQWDGKIRFFYKTGKTSLYLLPLILPIVANAGYSITLQDKRKISVVTPPLIDKDIFADILHIDTQKPIILRDYQVDGVNAAITNGNGIIVAGTGSGKTLSIAALIKAYSNFGIKALVIVPDQTLIRQTKAELINCQLNTGEYSGTNKTLDHQHVVSTWQALKNNANVIPEFQMIIVDECQGLKGPVLSQIVTANASQIPYRFGFTGTIPKEPADAMAVNVAVGQVVYTMGAAELIDRGILSTVQIDIIQLEEDLRAEYNHYCAEESIGAPPTYLQFKDGYFPDFASEKNYVAQRRERIEWIARAIETKRDMKKGNVLCLVDNIAIGRKLSARVEGSIFVNGQDVKDAKKRQVIYDMFKDQDDLVVFATIHIAGTGLNIPRIFNLMMIDAGKSFIRVIQAIGRGLRKASDKESVVVTDICSDLKYSRRHARMRMNYYKESGYPHNRYEIKYIENNTVETPNKHRDNY